MVEKLNGGLMKKSKSMKDNIMEQSNLLFSKYGYEKTTMDDIAKAVGKKKSALYYYFSTKEDVFIAVIEGEIDMIKSKIINNIESQESAKDKLNVYVLTRFKMFGKLANFYQTFKEDYVKNYDFVQKIRRGYDITEGRMIEAIFKYGVERGEFKKIDISLTAESFVTAMKGFEYRWATGMNHKYVEEVIKTMMNIFFYGIATGEGK